MKFMGQGSPLWPTLLAWLCLACLADCMPLGQLWGQSIPVELRAVWGGGPVRAFDGSISLSEGTLEPIRNLSMQDDAVGTLERPSQNKILIKPHSASSFGGADLRVVARPESQLEFVFRPTDNATTEPVKVTLDQLLNAKHSAVIDAAGTRLVIERLVHDRLLAQINDGQVIVGPGEPSRLVVEGKRTGLAGGEYRLTVKQVEAATGRVHRQLHQDVVLDNAGDFPKATFQDFQAPMQSGVYAFEISLQRRRLISSIVATGTSLERRLEWVVASSGHAQASEANPSEATRSDGLVPNPLTAGTWREVGQLYPAGVSWWDSLGKFRVPAVKSLVPLVGQFNPAPLRSFGSGPHQRRQVQTHECMVLEGNGWHAFPLSVSTPGQPHRLRIKTPADAHQRLVFSVHEPSGASDPSSLRADSGMIVEPLTIAHGHFVEHELVFWPKTASGYLLIFNADPHQTAALAEIMLEVVPLLSEPTDVVESSSSQADDGRICSLYMDKPLLAENFGAERRVDSSGVRELDSWLTWYQASERLAQYTQWSGFNAATITVASQGGTIYPSTLLAPTAKFDSGLFLTDGSSPELKDGVELLCRQFNQRGLKLILAIDIEGALPELERITSRAMQTQSTAATIDVAQPAGESSNPTNLSVELKKALTHYQVDTEGNLAVRVPRLSDSTTAAERPMLVYNPLDARVQTALERVVEELAERYGHHRCFAGVQLNLSPRSHFNFAGDLWGYDESTLARFQDELGAMLPDPGQQRAKLLKTTLRLNYLRYRAEQLTRFYVRLSKQLRQNNPQAKLVLNPAKLIATPPEPDKFAAAAQGTLPLTEILLGCGIDLQRIAAEESLMLLRPQTDSPLRSPPARAWSYQIQGDTRLDAQLAKASGLMMQQLPTSFRLPDYDRVSPLGDGRARTWLFPHAMLAGDAARRQLVQRLYHHDAAHIAWGGWLVPLGQEAHLRPLFSALAQLPAEPMQELNLPAASTSLRARSLQHRGQTFLQLINNASWPETVFVQLRSSVATEVRQLGTGTPELLKPRPLVPGVPLSVQLEMPAYSLVALSAATDEVEVLSITSTPPVQLADLMQQRVTALQALIDRAGQLNEPQTLGLQGGDFEAWSEGGKPLGWNVSTHPSTSVAREDELPHSGRSCLRLENRSETGATAWVQSERIGIPTTGRLALEVWARGAPRVAQPAVRLSVTGRYRDGRRFQRSHEFVTTQSPAETRGVASQGPQLTADWGRRPLVLLVPDVPHDELQELAVSVDLVGQGTIWIDDVRVYGMYLHPDERVHLSGQMFVASQQMRQGDFRLADELLHSFWSVFLSTYLPTTTESGQSPLTREAMVSPRPPQPGPAWKSPANPRLQQWQDTLRNRWQR